MGHGLIYDCTLAIQLEKSLKFVDFPLEEPSARCVCWNLDWPNIHCHGTNFTTIAHYINTTGSPVSHRF
jgi:hypothetical protein